MGQKVEETIEVQNEYVQKLKDMDRKKLEFSSMVSHELKTPIANILLLSENLKEGKVPEERLGEFSKRIFHKTLQLQHQIENLLTLSKIRKGLKNPGHKSEFILKDKLEEILVPTHQVTEVKKGKRTKKEKKFFPGYVLIKVELTKQIYHLIKNLQRDSTFFAQLSKRFHSL